MEGRVTLLITLVLLGFIRGKAFDFNLIFLALPVLVITLFIFIVFFFYILFSRKAEIDAMYNLT
jgi:Zn-dependent protease with chaperone function